MEQPKQYTPEEVAGLENSSHRWTSKSTLYKILKTVVVVIGTSFFATLVAALLSGFVSRFVVSVIFLGLFCSIVGAFLVYEFFLKEKGRKVFRIILAIISAVIFVGFTILPLLRSPELIQYSI